MTKLMYKKALEYSNKKGWIIIPLHSPNDEYIKKELRGKKPMVNAYQKMTKPLDKYELKDWLFDSENNIGVVTGKYSDVTVIDFDSYKFRDDLFSGVDINTLHDERIATRGHYYFKYTSQLNAMKLHELGIEILNNGNNCVIAPSIHRIKGQKYKWINEDAPLQEFPSKVIENLNHLIKIKHELYSIISSCRSWVKSIWKINTDKKTKKHELIDIHDEDTMVALVTELICNGSTEEQARMFCCIMLPSYDRYYTLTKYRKLEQSINQKGIKPWKNETLKEKLPLHIIQYIKNDTGRAFNPEHIDPEIANRAIAFRNTLYIVEDGNTIEFHENGKKNKPLKYKLRKDGEKIFDDNFRNSGTTLETTENNSSLYAYYLYSLKNKGIPLTQHWSTSSNTCKTRVYKRMIVDANNNWATELYVKCKTLCDGKYCECNEYVPIVMQWNPIAKKNKIRTLYQKGIDTKTLQSLFGYQSREGILKNIRDLIKNKRNK